MRLFSALVFGLFIGSFLNVCIYRWPRNLSILFPQRSFCPWCKCKISWFDNIPVISYFIIRRRCRACHSRISSRYAFVESLTALFALLIFRHYTDTPHLIISSVVACVAIVTTFSDLEWKIIPDQTSIGLIIFAVLTAAFNPFLPSVGSIGKIYQSVLGMSIGLLVPMLISFVGKFIIGTEVIGLGDVKLLMGYGAIFGISGFFSLLFLSFITAGIFCIVGLLAGIFKRRQYLAFGPFINIAAIALLFIKYESYFDL